MMSNWKFFIARRIYRSREGEKEVSKPAVRIAMAGIAIGLAVMIVSVAVVIGFVVLAVITLTHLPKKEDA